MTDRPLTAEGEALLRRHYRTDPGPGLTGGYLDGRAAMAASIRAIEDAARAPLLDVIEGLLAQHAGWAETDPPGLSADRLSANERAFEALGWDDPHPMPDLACDEPGCLRRADCGWPSDAGYRWTCGGHMRAGDRP